MYKYYFTLVRVVVGGKRRAMCLNNANAHVHLFLIVAHGR